MHLEFMKPDIWDGLVIGVVLVGLALAVLRIISDRSAYRREQSRSEDEERQARDHDASTKN
ncbi:MAG TPA: hypothetical protein VMT24_17220 [Aggregatilineaceae bacterium]|jgi:hypothetical protein|nr:hypothetical protein [Aggregatilineaceae bacterium]